MFSAELRKFHPTFRVGLPNSRGDRQRFIYPKTLQDAADYIAASPMAEQDAVDWQLAMETLVIAAGRGGEVTLAWEAVHRALNQGAPPSPEP